ncbi:hypothetical protein FCH28_06595 [Streptomyces piniterrae]|uniref:Uncharacterized protein n=1 Tax=Streptomyces piniterrae TaxID=2571125 RepID=A0A4U0NSK1_9ACTN|nr:hypothetical protein FCH28_06595 [Streptomyces piniterrae]
MPADPATGAPAWRCALVFGEAPAPYEEEWQQGPQACLPTTTEVTAYGNFPEAFANAGPAGHRYPVSVEHFDIEDEADMCGALRAAAGNPDPCAEQAIALLTGALESVTGVLDRRVRCLVGYLAGALTAEGMDLLRIAVAAEPGGLPLNNELHLLVRDFDGRTRRLALAPAVSLPATSPRPATTLTSRIALTTALLSECLWMNNNNQVTFHVSFKSPGVDLEFEDGETPEEADAYGRLRRLDDASFAAVLAESERNAVDMARGLAGDYEDEASPEIPGDQLVSWLGRELLDTVTTAVTGAPGKTPTLVYCAGFPLEFAGDGACLLMVGPERIGVIEIDDSY